MHTKYLIDNVDWLHSLFYWSISFSSTRRRPLTRPFRTLPRRCRTVACTGGPPQTIVLELSYLLHCSAPPHYSWLLPRPSRHRTQDLSRSYTQQQQGWWLYWLPYLYTVNILSTCCDHLIMSHFVSVGMCAKTEIRENYPVPGRQVSLLWVYHYWGHLLQLLPAGTLRMTTD